MSEKFEQYRKEALARGAIEVRDDVPGRGFQDDEVIQDSEQLGPQLAAEVAELEDRIANLKMSPATDEVTAEYREGNESAVRSQKLPFQSELEDWHPGKVLTLPEFMQRLQVIDPTFFVSDQIIMSMRGLGLVAGGNAIYSGVAVQDRIMPEWTQLRFDRYGVACGERKRGWRAVLLGLIHRGHITEKDCKTVFGEPELSNRSRPWYRTLFTIRNGRCPECGHALCQCKDRWDCLRADAYQYTVPSEIEEGRRQIVEKNDSPIWVP